MNQPSANDSQQKTKRRFLFLLSSTRMNGNSEQLAREAAKNLSEDVEQVWLRLTDFELPNFADQRHSGDGSYPAPEGAAARLLDETLAATDIVLVTPLYWYSLPTPAKHYFDHWSGWMRVPGVNFLKKMAGRRLWNITVTADEDQSFAQPMIASLRLIADYAKMSWQGAMIGYGNRPGDVMQDAPSMQRAKQFLVPN